MRKERLEISERHETTEPVNRIVRPQTRMRVDILQHKVQFGFEFVDFVVVASLDINRLFSKTGPNWTSRETSVFMCSVAMSVFLIDCR